MPPSSPIPLTPAPSFARSVRDTLNNLILKSPQSWQTSVGLPFFQIQGTVVEWDEVRFDVRLMQRVPYEGISRMQTSLRRRHRDRVVRRGLAMMIESDFYATDAGRQHFADQLKSIRYCVQETCNFDTLYAYLVCIARLSMPPTLLTLCSRIHRPAATTTSTTTATRTSAPSATSAPR
jgi:hypothetical protein